MKKSILVFAVTGLLFGACHKSAETSNNTDFAALETQGRFIQSRYGEAGIENGDSPSSR